ncbi:beta propeller repeat protein [Phytohabitans suffuscus]|uniref:Exo-alpha-sialidase n=1 Tax=Phytohabitans suffuscus TaxID=624315 RepID=A0A6F8YWG6_9ACTN|nr:hypothetical protein [Phytohabitans suffuscus]BCB90487.1 hypothetical protein Psuf_078000 [Phytohabitans suffuscus]
MSNRHGRPAAGAALSLALLAAAAACRPDAAPPAATPSTPAAAPPPAEVVVDVGLPDGFEPLSVEFGDARQGYALFVRCRGRCEARLFHTMDGGRTWRPRAHPRPEADNHQLYAGAGPVVVLLAEPHSWYVSRDGGASWQPRPYDARGGTPAEYHSAYGTFYLDCPDSGARCAIRDWTAGTAWREEPPVELAAARSLTNGRDGRVWLSGVDGGRIVTAVGRIGAGFTRLAVPEQPGRAVWNARVAVSADGEDVWLVADQEPSGGSGGGSAATRALARKGTGLPLLWQYQDGSWVPRPVTGVEEKPNWPYSVAPAGGGLLAIAGPERTGYLDRGAYLPADRAPRLDWVGQLPDGTLLGRDNRPGVNHLSHGTGASRSWATVRVHA